MQGGGEVLQAHKVMKQKNSSVHFATVAMRGGGTRPGGTCSTRAPVNLCQQTS